MIDLIEKIHELKDYENYDYDQAITAVEILLNHYNIIATPKTIKLSEIISKLNEKLILETDYKAFVKRFDKDIFIVVKKPYRNFEGMVANINSTNKIVAIDGKYIIESCKWLYSLWLTGTIVEDDLKEWK